MTTDVAADGSVPIQQSPTERADPNSIYEIAKNSPRASYHDIAAVDERDVDAALGGYVPGGSRVHCWLPAVDGHTIHQTARDVMRSAIAAVDKRRSLASQAAQPAEADGVERVAEALFSRVDDRKWNDPRIDMLTKDEWRDLAKAAIAATPPAPATDAGEVGPCFLCAGKCRGHSLVDVATWEPEAGSQAQRIRDGVAPALATPPAPNDDLRAENERLRAALTTIATGKMRQMEDGSTELIDDPDIDPMEIASVALLRGKQP